MLISRLKFKFSQEIRWWEERHLKGMFMINCWNFTDNYSFKVKVNFQVYIMLTTQSITLIVCTVTL